MRWPGSSLAQVLARLGQHERAARMLAQAQGLQASASVPSVAGAAAHDGGRAGAPAMDRIEITQSAGMARLRRGGERLAGGEPP